MFIACDRRHQTADRVQDLNRRIPALGRQIARQNDMAVEKGSGSIDNRVLLVIALHQNRVEGDNTSLLKLSLSLNQSRHSPEDGWRIPLRGGRLPRRKTNLARG